MLICDIDWEQRRVKIKKSHAASSKHARLKSPAILASKARLRRRGAERSKARLRRQGEFLAKSLTDGATRLDETDPARKQNLGVLYGIQAEEAERLRRLAENAIVPTPAPVMGNGGWPWPIGTR